MNSLSQTTGPQAPPAIPGGATLLPDGPARYRAVLDQLSEVVFQTDTEGRWAYLSAAWEELFGYRMEDSLGHAFLESVHPEEVEATVQMFERVVDGELDSCRHETRYQCADGSYRWIEVRASLLRDAEDRYIGNVGTIVDISARRSAQQLLATEARVLEAIAAEQPLDETLATIGEEFGEHLACHLRVHSAVETALPHRSNGELARLNRSPSRNLKELPPVLEPGQCVEIALLPEQESGQRGSAILCALGAQALLDRDQCRLLQRALHLAEVAIDRRLALRSARFYRLHDPLTGLPNRTLVMDRLDQALGLSRHRGMRVAVLVVDLDDFKALNEALGHEAGDQVLRHTAQRLSDAIRATDTVCRMDGDDFVVVLTEIESDAEAEEMARTVRTRLADPLPPPAQGHRLTASVGVALCTPGADDDPHELVGRADAAMVRAKRLDLGVATYATRVDERRARSLGLVGELHRAVEHDELRLEFQPQWCLRTGVLAGVEALVRWEHPTRGLLMPGNFIPLAENTGVIRPLSYWVLEHAIAAVRDWLPPLDAMLAVNVPPRLLHDPRFVDELSRLTSTGPQVRLELEVTEGAVMIDPESAIETMTELVNCGIRFALDDFGVGYSSLNYLKRLPVHALKIDKSFVLEMTNDDRDAAIVRSTIDLAHHLGMAVVGEGVESQQALDLLIDLDCDLAQGYHLSRPMPSGPLADWLVEARVS
ncbi:MAG: putative bifunctional diguanylate cyclase/phosphodiesterase [Egibacteraceae bacterium]